MPPSLIDRANEILRQLEEKNAQSGTGINIDTSKSSKVQLSIFDAHSATFETIRKLLEAVDINRLTPVEALLKLQEVKNTIR